MKLIFLFLVTLVCNQQAFAFPEFVRHGYVNCTACHFSPTGGGLLTAYGRSLAQEVLSYQTFNPEFLAGAVKTPEWLSLGGQVRMLQSHRETSTASAGRFILMQADLEAAATFGDYKWTALATLGKNSASAAIGSDRILSRRHWIKYQLTDEVGFRAGRFFHAFGINTPDHILVTKRFLNWDFGQETYNVESSYLGEEWSFFGTLNLGRIDKPALHPEKGFALRAAKSLSNKHKLGMSYFYGSETSQKRHVAGPFAVLGLSEQFFMHFELDFLHTIPNGTTTQFGFVNYLRFFFEVTKGWQLFLNQELSRPDLTTHTRDYETYGVGTQFFPIPHVQLQLMYQRMINGGNRNADLIWGLLHVYL